MPKALKITLKVVAIVLAAVVLVVGGYVAYAFIAYHRLGNMTLTDEGDAKFAAASAGVGYKMVSYNVGFGAYEDDYGFFMDGGTQSWAWSKERLDKNLNAIVDLLKAENADFYHLQEVDADATRTYPVDERAYFIDGLKDMSYVYAPNFDSPFLFYPFTQPHGASKSGIMTFSSFAVNGGERIELPVESGVIKIVDLDRCYSKSYVSVEGGKPLVLYNFHLSAYTSDGKIAEQQLKVILSDMKTEYENGNYCVAGGDFNKDLLGDSSAYFGKSDKEYNWAQAIPDGTFEAYDMTLTAPLDIENPVPSSRNADSAYHKGQFVVTIDGFVTSKNVEVVSSAVIDTGFKYSDHNPVTMTFRLKAE
ncbi:MAG: endonuclease/exonuclease/phosphatase family protein [Clostridia bacterium]|nr:endonuclease/exonuclease/phosphatase family protein [Clostridia bacterium]